MYYEGNNELYHKSHKYTKKWYSNGRWHYYYGYDTGSNLIEKVADKMGFDERKNYRVARNHSRLDLDMVNHVKAALRNPKNRGENVQSFIKGSLKGYSENHDYSKRLTNKYLHKYKQTPLYKIEGAIKKTKSSAYLFIKKLKNKIAK